jgi:hypothetical protein
MDPPILPAQLTWALFQQARLQPGLHTRHQASTTWEDLQWKGNEGQILRVSVSCHHNHFNYLRIGTPGPAGGLAFLSTTTKLCGEFTERVERRGGHVNNSGEGVGHKRGACYVICAYGRHESLRECQREQCLDFSKCNLESFSSLSSVPLLHRALP